MNIELPGVFLIANKRSQTLGGISFLERQLRILQRLGFREATICSTSGDCAATQLHGSSWARAELRLKFVSRPDAALTIEKIRQALPASGRLLFCGEDYCDARLWRALAQRTTTTLLIESDPPAGLLPLWAGLRRRSFGFASRIALLEPEWLARMEPAAALLAQLEESAATARIEVIDASQERAYVTGQRRDVRPLWFPAPEPARQRLAESVLYDGIQNGVLDFPALLHAPIETWIVRRLCRTAIRPNHVTCVTLLLGLAVTLFLANGNLWPGTVFALAVGVLDGIDGKLARLKVETTELGKREHALDYALELTWWTALAHYFSVHDLGAKSWVLWLLFVGSDLIARAAKSVVKKKTDRNLDDVSRFDRRFRLIAGRRNIYIWIFAAGLILGMPAVAFQLLCWWGVATAAVHVLRSWQIRSTHPPGTADGTLRRYTASVASRESADPIV